MLIESLQDTVPQVKDTAAWTLGRICQQLTFAIPHTLFDKLVFGLVAGLQDSPRIASNCCWALMNLGQELNKQEDHTLATTQLSNYFEGICTALLRVCDQPENEANCRTSAYEALAILATHAPADSMQTVYNLMTAMLDRLESSVTAPVVGQDERNQHLELQSNICNVITSITRRTGNNIAGISDRIMAALLQLIQTSGQHATTMEDAFLAVCAITTGILLC